MFSSFLAFMVPASVCVFSSGIYSEISIKAVSLQHDLKITALERIPKLEMYSHEKLRCKSLCSFLDSLLGHFSSQSLTSLFRYCSGVMKAPLKVNMASSPSPGEHVEKVHSWTNPSTYPIS